MLIFHVGTIREFSQLGGISSSMAWTDEDRAAGLNWKRFPATSVKEFFEYYAGKCNSLEWIPMPENGGRPSWDILS